MFEQLADLRVGFHVHPGEQRAVLGQEVPDTEGIGGVAGADQPEADEVRRLAQELPPGDECLQDDVTHDRTLVERGSQRIPRDLDHLAIAFGHGADE